MDGHLNIELGRCCRTGRCRVEDRALAKDSEGRRQSCRFVADGIRLLGPRMVGRNENEQGEMATALGFVLLQDRHSRRRGRGHPGPFPTLGGRFGPVGCRLQKTCKSDRFHESCTFDSLASGSLRVAKRLASIRLSGSRTHHDCALIVALRPKLRRRSDYSLGATIAPRQPARLDCENTCPSHVPR
jgi:hypothetical protein